MPFIVIHWMSFEKTICADLCQVALEAQALRLRMTEDHLAAEKQAAEETEAVVMQRHQAALQALETKHQLGSLGFVSCFCLKFEMVCSGCKKV